MTHNFSYEEHSVCGAVHSVYRVFNCPGIELPYHMSPCALSQFGLSNSHRNALWYVWPVSGMLVYFLYKKAGLHFLNPVLEASHRSGYICHVIVPFLVHGRTKKQLPTEHGSIEICQLCSLAHLDWTEWQKKEVVSFKSRSRQSLICIIIL